MLKVTYALSTSNLCSESHMLGVNYAWSHLCLESPMLEVTYAWSHFMLGVT